MAGKAQDRDNNDPKGLSKYFKGLLGGAAKDLQKPATRNLSKNKKKKKKDK